MPSQCAQCHDVHSLGVEQFWTMISRITNAAEKVRLRPRWGIGHPESARLESRKG
jgi:hypothetical protein